MRILNEKYEFKFLKIERNKISIYELLIQRCHKTTGSNFWKSKKKLATRRQRDNFCDQTHLNVFMFNLCHKMTENSILTPPIDFRLLQRSDINSLDSGDIYVYDPCHKNYCNHMWSKPIVWLEFHRSSSLNASTWVLTVNLPQSIYV